MKQSDWLIFIPGSLEASGKILRDFAELLADILIILPFFLSSANMGSKSVCSESLSSG